MEDKLAIINRVIAEHQVIRGHIKLVGDSIPDKEALSSLERARSDWIPGRTDGASEKQQNLQQTISFLDEGLKSHFAFEEKALPPLLGELFMRALILQHREIVKEIDQCKSRVAETSLEGLSREELLSTEANMQQIINSMCHTVEEHQIKEEVILEMLQSALQEKG